MTKKLILFLCLTLFTLPQFSQAEQLYNNEDGYHYYFDDSSGFYIRLDNPRKNNISTNIIEELTFTVLWYDKQNDKPYFSYDRINRGTFSVNTTVKHLKITKQANRHVYTIHDLDTELTKTTTGFKIPIEIENYDSSNTSYRNFLGEDGQIDIELNYYHVDHSNAKYYVDFTDGKDMKMFGDKLMLRFPPNSYIADNSLFQSVLLDQKLIVDVWEKPISSDNLLFLSQQFTIDDVNRSYYAKPNTWGDITIAYEGTVPKAMEGYNLTVLKNINGKWVPIGGIVDSQKKTVTAVFDNFGTYAIGLVYKDYGLQKHWAKKEALGLAYKGIIQPEINTKDQALLLNMNKPITRLTYTVLLSRTLGFQPMDYTGVFSDIDEANYSEDELGYLMAGVMNGLVYGKESNLPGYMIIEPDKPITREEAVAFLARAIELNAESAKGSKTSRTSKRKSTSKQKGTATDDPKEQLQEFYKDANKISDWAANSVLQVTNEKFIGANNGNFNPKRLMTNAEAMSIIYHLMETKNLK